MGIFLNRTKALVTFKDPNAAIGVEITTDKNLAKEVKKHVTKNNRIARVIK